MREPWAGRTVGSRVGRSVAVSLSGTGGYAVGTYTAGVRAVVVPRVGTVYVLGVAREGGGGGE